MILDYIWVFLVGGAICAVGQILLDKTKLTPARVLVLFVVAGPVLVYGITSSVIYGLILLIFR